MENLSQRSAEIPPEFIFVKTENRLEKIMLSEIVYIEGMRDYRRIHTENRRERYNQQFCYTRGSSTS